MSDLYMRNWVLNVPLKNIGGSVPKQIYSLSLLSSEYTKLANLTYYHKTYIEVLVHSWDHEWLKKIFL